MGESNTAVSAYTLYMHLQQYCFHPSICLVVRASPPEPEGRGFGGRPRQTKVFKTGSSGFPTPLLALSIMGIALRLARQWQGNGLVKYWLK